jgi:hypothetical protein
MDAAALLNYAYVNCEVRCLVAVQILTQRSNPRPWYTPP